MTRAAVGRAPEAAAPGRQLAAVVADVTGELGIREDRAAVAAEVLELIQDPVELYRAHPIWPSRLTETGLPVELSLKLDPGGRCAIRCVADVTDHRTGLAGNWSRYLRYAGVVAGRSGARERDLWRLCQRHLTGGPPALRTRMMHGLGYAGGGWSRGSLYFHTGWLGPEHAAQRFPAEIALVREAHRRHGSPADRGVDVLSYDFVPDEPERAKAYVWPGLDAGAGFRETVGRHPDLEPARELFDAFRAGADSDRRSRSLLLQLSRERGAIGQRLFFFSSAWGWSTRQGLDRLLGFLDRGLGVDLAPLFALGAAGSAHRLPLSVVMVAIAAAAGAPSVTFYLWPLPDPTCAAGQGIRDPERISGADGRAAALAAPVRAGRAELLEHAERAVDGAVAYLTAARGADGRWRDYEAEPSDGLATAHVAATLRVEPARRLGLEHARRWLRAAHRPGRGWGRSERSEVDAETTALALAALAGSDPGLPPDADSALVDTRLPDGSWRAYRDGEADVADGSGPPEVTAAVLLALLQACPDRVGWIVPAVFALVGRQRRDGGWSAFWWNDDLMATWRAVRALEAYGRGEFAATALGRQSRLAAAAAVSRARAFLTSLAVPREPFALALWLGGWLAAGGDAGEPAVARALLALRELQQPDGCWLGSPQRRLGGEPAAGELYVDDRCVITTATVTGALQALAAI